VKCVWHEFKGQPKTELSSANGYVPFEADIDGSWWDANLGVDYQADKNSRFSSQPVIKRCSMATATVTKVWWG
jgi:hypothetical protein